MDDDNKDLSSPDMASAGREEFFEDFFGLNFRTVKTLWASFKNPIDYFQAALAANWQNKYTPSIRLLLGIGAITVATHFLWAKPNGNFIEIIHEAVIAGLEDGYAAHAHQNLDFSNVDIRHSLSEAMKLAMVIYTPIYIALLSLFAWIYRGWGEDLSYVVRQRYVFALAIPAAVFGVIWSIITIPFSGIIYDVMTYGQIIVLVLILFVTAIRGPFGHLKKSDAFGKAFILTFWMMAFSLIAQLAAVLFALQKIVGPEIKIAIKAAAGG
ncbi:hypothetical protein [Fretibacter rubidus]|uniref:hypothetical protein n=1 Tax=Fretibacter rubidus TaxID=570162 RepID=UPI00352B71A5